MFEQNAIKERVETYKGFTIFRESFIGSNNIGSGITQINYYSAEKEVENGTLRLNRVVHSIKEVKKAIDENQLFIAQTFEQLLKDQPEFEKELELEE